MSKTVKWMLAGILVVIGAAAVIALILRGDRSGAVKASIDMMNAWHKQDLDSKRAKVDALTKDYTANKEKIEKLDADIRTKRVKLEKQYVKSGLTNDEIADRLSNLGY